MQDIDKAMAVWIGVTHLPARQDDLTDPARRMRHNHRDLIDSRGRLIDPGDSLSYDIDGLRGDGEVVADPVFRGGLRCNGMSVLSIIEDAEWVNSV